MAGGGDLVTQRHFCEQHKKTLVPHLHSISTVTETYPRTLPSVAQCAVDRDIDGIGVINLATVGGAAGHWTIQSGGIHRHCFHPAFRLRGEPRILSPCLAGLVPYFHLFYWFYVGP